MKRILTVITMAILTLTAIGTAEARQQTDSRNSLAGKVSDAATSAPIEFATVALILPDSTFVDGTTTIIHRIQRRGHQSQSGRRHRHRDSQHRT